MAIVHVRLDVDSDVYPELHAMLAAIDRAATRSERVRQLASSGLIWEHLRVQGPLKVDIEVGMDVAVEPVRVVAPPAPAPTVADVKNPARTPKRAARPPQSPQRNLPILYDAVEVSPVEGSQRAPDSTQTSPAGASVESVLASERKTGPRARLLRMKEKGLFNNS